MSVASKLLNTSKGRLTYGPNSSVLKPDTISTSNLKSDSVHTRTPRRTPPVFGLKSLTVALEAIEDEAVHEDKLHRAKEKKKFVENSFQKIDETLNEGTDEWINGDIEAAISSFNELLDQRKQKFVINNARKRELFLQNARREAEDRLRKMKEENLRKRLLQKKHVQEYIQQRNESAQRIKQESREQDQRKARLLKTKLQEAEDRQRMHWQLEQKRIKEGKERLQTAKLAFPNCKNSFDTIKNMVAAFKYKEELKEKGYLGEYEKVVENFKEALKLLKEASDNGLISRDELNNVNRIFDKIAQCEAKFKNELESLHNECVLEEQAQLLRQEEKKRELEQKQRKEAEKARIEELKKSHPEYNTPKLPKELQLCITRSSYDSYMHLQNKLKEYEEASKIFSKQTETKHLMFNLRKNITTLITNISGRSGSEVLNTVKSLVNILNGQTVTVGSNRVSTEGNPQATKYALDLIAKKIMHQAKSQIAANFDAAFGVALAVLGLWSQSKEFGDLFLAQLHKACPFTVPYYIPKLGRSAIEYRKILGYNIDSDGIVEKQDVYLKRMSGLIRLYAAVIQSPLPPGITDNPHGLAEGWKWFARMLRLEPRPDITATIIYDFLDVTGHAMMRAYSKQFQKILYSLIHDFYPKIEEICENKAAVSRLKAFLEKCVTERTVPHPEGHLSSSFWNTYHAAGEVTGD